MNNRRRLLITWAAKPTACPYCHSRRISASLGRWWCLDCDGEGSY